MCKGLKSTRKPTSLYSAGDFPQLVRTLRALENSKFNRIDFRIFSLSDIRLLIDINLNLGSKDIIQNVKNLLILARNFTTVQK